MALNAQASRTMTRLIVECIIRGNWLPQSNAVQLDQVEAAEGAEENEAQRRRRIGPCRVSLSFSPGFAVCGAKRPRFENVDAL